MLPFSLPRLRLLWLRHPIAFPGCMLALWLLLTLGWRALAMPDEGRYATIALDMAHSGHWQVPLINGLPFFHKPPLFYWITGAGLQLFGAYPWVARLASALGAWLMGMGLYLFLRRHAPASQARWTLMLLATVPLYFGAAQYVNLDMLVAGLISITILAAVHAALLMAQGLPSRGWLWAAYALAALGMLAKGLIGLILPGAVLVAWLLWQGQWRMLLRMLSLPGLLLFTAISLPWFVQMEQSYPGFFHYFFVYQHFQRFTETGFNNQHPFWFYLPVLVLLSLPWTIWLPAWLWRQRPWHGVHVRAMAACQPAPLASPQALLRLWLVWLVVIVGFFSIPHSKLVGYILPCLPAWAALLAHSVIRPAQAQGSRRHWFTLAAAAWLCTALIAALAWWYPGESSRKAAAPLRQAMQPGDQMVMLDTYAYDLPFYLDSTRPIWIVSHWNDPDLLRHDNWRKELLDAGVFNRPLGATVLITPEQFEGRMCQVLQQGHTVWVWGYNNSATGMQYPVLQNTPMFWSEAASHKNPRALWQLTGPAAQHLLHCG